MIDLTYIQDARVVGIFYDNDATRLILTFESEVDAQEFIEDGNELFSKLYYEHNIMIQL